MVYTALSALSDRADLSHEDWVKQMYFGRWRRKAVPEEIKDDLVWLLDQAAERAAKQAIIQERLRVAAKSEEKV